MWFIMFLILISDLDKKIIFGCFVVCCLTEAFCHYLDYQKSNAYQEALVETSTTYNEILKQIVERNNNND